MIVVPLDEINEGFFRFFLEFWAYYPPMIFYIFR